MVENKIKDEKTIFNMHQDLEYIAKYLISRGVKVFITENMDEKTKKIFSLLNIEIVNKCDAKKVAEQYLS